MGLIIGVLTGVGAVLIAVAIASSLGMTALEFIGLLVGLALFGLGIGTMAAFGAAHELSKKS
jgi:hypothetical protein